MPSPPVVINIHPPKLPSWLGCGPVLAAFGALLLIIAALSSFYTVPQDSIAVVLRFGKFNSIQDPGLRFKLPLGIDRATVLPVRRQMKMEFGFGTNGATNLSQFSPRDQQQLERSMITGDRNAALVDWVVQYRIQDAKQYLFDVRNPDETLRDVSESVMREVIGDRTVDEILTVGRQEIESEALKQLCLISDKYGLGIVVDQVQLKDVSPPVPVQASFNEVNQSQQERESLINAARGQYNRAVPQARGSADQKVSEAKGQAVKRTNEATGDAERFNTIFKAYLKSPEITRQRLYLESVAEILPKFQRRILMDEGQSSVLPLLQLDQNPSRQPQR
jgi:membrane protease subunit HflK